MAPRHSSFKPSRDIPNLSGKVILVTGGTPTLCENTVLDLARHHPEHIILCGWDELSIDITRRLISRDAPDVRITPVRCDLSSLEDVKRAATYIRHLSDRLDILILQGNIMPTDIGRSPEGYETQFATNHLGPALLVKLLLPTLFATQARYGDARIINVTSIGYMLAPRTGIDFATLKSCQSHLGLTIAQLRNDLIGGNKWVRNGQSKLAQMLYSGELARHYPRIMCVSVHPGFVETCVIKRFAYETALLALKLGMKRWAMLRKGQYNQCWAATCERSKLQNGGYYEPVGALKRPRFFFEYCDNSDEYDYAKMARELWTWTQEQLEGY